MTRLRIRNWDRFQQYKDREPKWIKLYRSLNHNYEWCQLSEKARAQLVGLWLLAAETGNDIPLDEPWIMQQISGRGQLLLDELVTYRFVIVYDDVQECTELYTEKRREETEKRREEERESKPRAKKFIPPTLDEIRAHVAEKGYTFDPEAFLAYYGSQGWKKANGQPVSSWQLCCVTFQKREGPRRQHVGATPEWHGLWTREDEEKHRDHPRWPEYESAMCDWQGSGERPGFEAWKEREAA